MNWAQRSARSAVLVLAIAVLWWRPLLVSAWPSAPGLAASAPGSLSTKAAQRQQAPTISLDAPLLKKRIAAPVQKEGSLVVDLSGLIIDLRTENPDSAAFAEQFYSLLQQTLNGKRPVGLNLSGTVIKGEMNLARLSLRIPAYGDRSLLTQSVPSAASPAVPSAVPSAASPETSLSASPETSLATFPTALATSLATPSPTETFAFQGALWLTQACFNGVFRAENLYMLGPVDAEQAIFTQTANWNKTRFTRNTNFSQATFHQESYFRSALFTGRTRFNGAVFNGSTDWQNSAFYASSRFAQASFQAANFSRSDWQTNADFDEASFQAPVTFQKSRFEQSVFFTDAQFEAAANLRQVHIQSRLSLRGALIRSQLDLGDARFGKDMRINVADLDFNAGEAKILGSPGQIGQRFTVASLESNEAVLQNLVRNFRLLEQVGDANQVEYTTEQLRLSAIAQQINRISLDQVPKMLHWLMLSGLLLLSDYGTNVNLVFSTGIAATTLFGLMFWLVDRYRRRVPTPIVPDRAETVSATLGSGVSLAIALSLLSQCQHPIKTIIATSLITLPLPTLILIKIYQQGRYHDLMDVSYFVKNGALRKLQVLIARLPIIPQYPFYRDRYQPLLTNRRWSWLNYYDFSLNNWFKFGFNDIRLRDKAVPGLVSALVWYQWSLGISYITLLLWTLSRTIPGLNLLLYF